MNVKQGDKFETAEKEQIVVTYADENKVSFQYVHGSARAGSISSNVFSQFIGNGYFKAVQS